MTDTDNSDDFADRLDDLEEQVEEISETIERVVDLQEQLTECLQETELIDETDPATRDARMFQ